MFPRSQPAIMQKRYERLPGVRPLSQGHGHSVSNSWELMPREEAKKAALGVLKALLRNGEQWQRFQRGLSCREFLLVASHGWGGRTGIGIEA